MCLSELPQNITNFFHCLLFNRLESVAINGIILKLDKSKVIIATDSKRLNNIKKI